MEASQKVTAAGFVLIGSFTLIGGTSLFSTSLVKLEPHITLSAPAALSNPTIEKAYDEIYDREIARQKRMEARGW